MKRIFLITTFLLLSCGQKEPTFDMTKENLLGVWDNMVHSRCYERYVFHKNSTFSYFDRNGSSNGSYSLLLATKKLGLYHQAAESDYLPFKIEDDGRMQVFKEGEYKYYVKVPNDYANNVDCPGEIPDEDDGGGEYPPRPTPTVSPKPTPVPTSSPVPTPMPTPTPKDDCKSDCNCECDCDCVTGELLNDSMFLTGSKLNCFFPIPTQKPKPTPAPNKPTSQKCKCKCKCK